jgi:hypothetical protein
VNDPCRVCGDPTSEHSHAVCYRCRRPYHLALRQDIPAKDCGQVWLDEELLALQFACNVCLEVSAPTDGTAPAAEASANPRGRRRYARHERVRAADVARARRQRRGV